MRKVLVAFILALSIVAQPGCATVVSKLPVVIGAVTDAMMILDSIEMFIEAYFGRHPEVDEGIQKKTRQAMSRTRSALHVALRIAQGSQNLNQAKIDAAFADFKVAYAELLALIAPFGVSSSSDLRMSVTSDSLRVPEPMALTLKI